jgi:hypothetical protein
VEGIEEGTDRWAVRHGYVSMTPLRLDLTDRGALERAQGEIPVDEPVTGGEQRAQP